MKAQSYTLHCKLWPSMGLPYGSCLKYPVSPSVDRFPLPTNIQGKIPLFGVNWYAPSIITSGVPEILSELMAIHIPSGQWHGHVSNHGTPRVDLFYSTMKRKPIAWSGIPTGSQNPAAQEGKETVQQWRSFRIAPTTYGYLNKYVSALVKSSS